MGTQIFKTEPSRSKITLWFFFRKNKANCMYKIGRYGTVIILILLILIIILILRNIVIVPQGFVVVTEFLGSYRDTWQPGLHVKIPLFERIARQINTKEIVGDFPAISAITKDNVMLTVDSVVFYKVRGGGEDAKKFAYGVTNPDEAIQLLAATNLRNVIGEMSLDEVLTSKDRINTSMRLSLDKATDDWGIEVRRVELKSLTPSIEIQEAMEQQKKASIKKEAEILEAEGHKQADILKAEGHKESTILNAEAENRKKILEAEAEEQGRIHRARGEAEAIRLVKDAEAKGIEYLKMAEPTCEVLTLKKFDTLAKVADGRATKIMLPTDLVDMSKSTAVVGEVLNTFLTNSATPTDVHAVNSKSATESLSTSETLNNPHKTIGNSAASSKCSEAICTTERTHQKAIFEPDI